MVRAVIVLIISVFVVLLGLMVGIAAIEPVAEEVKSFDSVDSQDSSTIDDVQTAVFEYMPLIVIGGLSLWALRWYLRRERFVGRR